MLFPLLLLLAVLVCPPTYAEVAVAEGADDYQYVTSWLWPQHVFDEPQGVAVGADGSVYVADTGRARIQKFTAEGGLVSMWGSPGPGPGQFDEPQDVAVGPDGSVYVLDTGNYRVQKFTAEGSFIIAWGSEGDAQGQFFGSCGIAVDQSGDVYVADTSNDRIQKFTSAGAFVAAWGEYGAADGEFQFPVDVAVDQSGHVYVADRYNHRIQKFTTAGVFVSAWGDYGTASGYFKFPSGVAVDGDGSVYVADRGNSRVQKFTATGGYVTKWGIAGDGDGEFAWDDVFGQVGVAVSSGGAVLVVDPGNDRIQTFTSGGAFVAAWGDYYGPRYPLTTYYDTYARPDYTVDQHGTLWDDGEYDGARLVRVTFHPGGDYRGTQRTDFVYDGPKLVQAVHHPSGEYQQWNAEEDIAVGPGGTVYVVDSNKPGVQAFTAAGEFVAQGPPVWALAITTDGEGHLHVVDSYQVLDYDQYGNEFLRTTVFRIRELDAAGDPLTVWELKFYAPAPDTDGFVSDAGLAVDGDGYVYLALTAKDRVYRFAPGGGGAVTSWGGTGSTNGLFSGPYGVAVDDAGYVYVSDTGNHRIQKFGSSGAFVAKWGTQGSGDGAFNFPRRIEVDADGDVFVADSGNHRIQKFDANGGFLAEWGSQGAGEGEFVTPYSVAVGPDGAVYVVDTGNRRRIQKFAPSAGDLTPPVTSDDYDGLWHRSSLTVRLTAADEPGGSGMSGGLARTEYSLDGGVTWVTGDAVFFRVSKRGGGSGLHTLLYRSTDAAGNAEEARSCEVKIDARHALTADDAPSGPQSGTVTVHLSAVDSMFGVTACSGVAATWYSLDGGSWAQGTSVPVSGAGLHWIAYYSVDVAGNVEYPQWCSVEILAAGGSRLTTRTPVRAPLARSVRPVRGQW